MTTPRTPSLTAPWDYQSHQSHHRTPPLTCEVSPVPPSLTSESHPSLTSLTTLRSETTETETETSQRARVSPNPMDGGR
jgi:hypothetical protein